MIQTHTLSLDVDEVYLKCEAKIDAQTQTVASHL
jgi:hypothetical protein